MLKSRYRVVLLVGEKMRLVEIDWLSIKSYRRIDWSRNGRQTGHRIRHVIASVLCLSHGVASIGVEVNGTEKRSPLISTVSNVSDPATSLDINKTNSVS